MSRKGPRCPGHPPTLARPHLLTVRLKESGVGLDLPRIHSSDEDTQILTPQANLSTVSREETGHFTAVKITVFHNLLVER